MKVYDVKITTARSLRDGMRVTEIDFEKSFYTEEVMTVGQPEAADEQFKESMAFFNSKMKREQVN